MSQPPVRGGEIAKGPTEAVLTPTDRALDIVECIYRAVLAPGVWDDVAAAVGRAFGDAGVAVSLALRGVSASRVLYAHGLAADYQLTHVSAAQQSFPWTPETVARLERGFVDLGSLFPEIELRESEFERTWMRPQGLPPVWPLAHLIIREGHVVAAMGIFRRGEERAFEASEIEFANLLVPHFARAYRLFVSLGGARQQRLALAEVMDRLAQGIFLLDERGRVTVTNRSARRIVAERDGLAFEDGALRAANASENALLKELVERAGSGRGQGRASGLLALARPSGRRPLTLYAAPLLESPSGDCDAVAVLFAADPEVGGSTARDALRQAYDLTAAEAALVQLLAQGHSLVEAARLRGVSRNTAKTQLRRVFEKTGTNRQSDLVRLILTGVPEVTDP